jgi:integrase
MTGPRVGDLYRLKRTNIVDDTLVYIPEKQKHKRAETLIIPLNEIAKQIIKDYANGADDRLFDFCSLYHYNKFIKAAFTLAEITRKVAILDTLSGEEVIKSINEIISSHAARRFFIGTIYNEVQDPNLIGELSGHTYGSRAFSRYRNVNSDIKKKLVSILDEKKQ